MPFGDNTQTYTVNVGRQERWNTAAPTVRVTAEAAEPPWWWSEYLTEEWKRKQGVTGRRDPRTALQRSEDKWQAQLRCWANEGCLLVDPVEPGAVLHPIWGTTTR